MKEREETIPSLLQSPLAEGLVRLTLSVAGVLTALAVHSASAAQVVTLDYMENDSRYQTAQPCRTLGGTVVTLNAREICAGIDKNDTFCIVGSDEAFPCAGLYKHVVQCNSEFNRPALNPFFCGEACSELIHEFPRGASCVFDISEGVVVSRGVTVAAGVTVIASAVVAKILEADRRALNLNPLATMDLTFEGAQMGDMQMTVGQVLILPEFDEVGESAFRVVTTVRQDGGNVVVRSRQAALAEVIPDGEFVATIDMMAPLSAARGGAAGCASAGILNATINRGFPSGGALSGCGSFGASVRSTIRLRGGRLERLGFGGSTSAEFFANIAGEARGEVSRDLIKKPGRVILKFSIPVPGAQVEIPMHIYVNSDIEAVSNVSGNVGAKYRATAAFDIDYNPQSGLSARRSYNDNWTTVNTVVSTLGGSFEVSSNFSRFEFVPFLSPVFRKRNSGRVDLGLNVVPVAGKLSLTVNAVPEFSRMCLGSPWFLTAGIRGHADLHLMLWDRLAAPSPPFIFHDEERAIAEGEAPLRGASPPTDTKTERWLRENITWGGKLDASVRVNFTSHLQAAVLVSDIESVCWLIANGADTEVKDDDRGWFLSNAAANNAPEVAQALINGGAEVNAERRNGETPLHAAVERDALQVAEILLESGADADATDEDGRTPLHAAAERDALQVAELLITSGAGIDEPDNTGETPLHWAARRNATLVAKLLIARDANLEATANRFLRTEMDGVMVITATIGGHTPLHWAARANNAEIAKLLIEGGAVIDAKNGVGSTPLLWAASENAPEVAKLLIDNGAVINAKNESGATPLHWAVYANAGDVVKLLIDNGADVNAKNEFGSTPLLWLASENAGDVVKLLIDNGADVNAKNESGSTPLHWAATENAGEAVKLLIDNGARVNAKNESGSTPLHWAAADNAGEAVKLLIANGADVNAKENDGITPLHWAALYAAPEVVKLLIDNDADVNAQDNEGYTPLDVSRSHEIDSLLLQRGGRCNATC